MKRREVKQHRPTQANAERTTKRVEQYYGKMALIATWEQTSDDVQIREHDYLLGLRARMRSVRSSILNRASPESDAILQSLQQ